MQAYSVTDIGKNRTENQDYVLSVPSPVGRLANLYLVADGMGGHRAGGFASRFCVETIHRLAAESSQEEPAAVLRDVIEQTNSLLREEAEADPALSGMGTTIVAATVEGSTLCVANVGDSRLYVFRQGTLNQITEDHSLVEVMIRNGDLDRNEARFHPNKNIITRALGGLPEVEVDFFEVPLQGEEIILMCSDGLSNMVDDEEMGEILEKYGSDLETAADQLVRRANDYGGRDNIAVVLVRP